MKGLQCGRLLLQLFALSSIFCLQALADEFPLTLLPIYLQATEYVGGCAVTASLAFSTSFGCPSLNPGPCMCTDALKSSKVAKDISSCAFYRDLPYSEISSATQLWRDYCRTAGGVSVIHDETKVEDIPLFTQVTEYMQNCFTQYTAAFRQTFGCTDYTVAPCLCGSPESSAKVWETVSECASSVLFGEESTSQQMSGSMLWSSYCDLNLRTTASRVITEPIKVAATPTVSTTDYYSDSTATPGDSFPLPTSNSGGSVSTVKWNVNWEAVGAVIGVVAILVAVLIAWWTNRQNQWLIHAMAKVGVGGNHPQQGQNGHFPSQPQNSGQANTSTVMGQVV